MLFDKKNKALEPVVELPQEEEVATSNIKDIQHHFETTPESQATLNISMIVDLQQESFTLTKDILRRLATINSEMFGHDALESDEGKPNLLEGKATASHILATLTLKKLQEISAYLNPMTEFVRT